MRRSLTAALACFLTLSLGLIACSKSDGDGGAAKAGGDAPAPAAAGEAAKKAAPAADLEQAKAYFAQTCSPCHGESGAGDGPGGANLNPKPRNFADAEWQKSVDDAYLSKIILSGGMAVGKSPIMPGNPGLKEKPEVLAGLVKLVREFGK